MGKKERKAALEARAQRERLRTEQILEIIERAFDGVPPPDPDHRTLYQAEPWDEYRIVDQRRDHAGRWQDLPEAHLRACQNALPHLDAQGIRYYLPAVMGQFVRSPGRTQWIHQSLLFMLQPSTGELKDHQYRRFSLLTHPQRAAILAFLEHAQVPEEDLRPWRRVVEGGDTTDWFRRFH